MDIILIACFVTAFIETIILVLVFMSRSPIETLYDTIGVKYQKLTILNDGIRVNSIRRPLITTGWIKVGKNKALILPEKREEYWMDGNIRRANYDIKNCTPMIDVSDIAKQMKKEIFESMKADRIKEGEIEIIKPKKYIPVVFSPEALRSKMENESYKKIIAHKKSIWEELMPLLVIALIVCFVGFLVWRMTS